MQEQIYRMMAFGFQLHVTYLNLIQKLKLGLKEYGWFWGLSDLGTGRYGVGLLRNVKLIQPDTKWGLSRIKLKTINASLCLFLLLLFADALLKTVEVAK